MIFWQHLQIQNTTAYGLLSFDNSKFVSNCPFAVNGTLSADQLDIAGAMNVGSLQVSGSIQLGSAVTLPNGSEISNVLRKQGRDYKLTTSLAEITSATINTASIGTASITALSVTNPINLPAGSSVNGKPIFVTEDASGFLLCDGHFGSNDDWVSVVNGTTSTYYLVCKLFKGDGTEYVVDGSVIQSQSCVAIAPGESKEILHFRDYWDDPFAGREQGQVQFYYSSASFSPADAYGTNPPSTISKFKISGAKLNEGYGGVVQIIENSTANSGIKTVLMQTDKMLIGVYQLGAIGNNDWPSVDDISRLLGFGISCGFAETDYVGFTGAVSLPSHTPSTNNKFQWWKITDLLNHEERNKYFANTKGGIIFFAKA